MRGPQNEDQGEIWMKEAKRKRRLE